MVELEHALKLLDTMRLTTAATLLDEQMERSLHVQHTYIQFLNELLTTEQQERGRKGEEMRTKLARLPHRKSLDEFDFSVQPSIDKRQINELASLSFAARTENIILLGPPGVGKTHLAVGIAIRHLRPVLRFTTPVYPASLKILSRLLNRIVWNGAGGFICARLFSLLTRSAIPSSTDSKLNCFLDWYLSATSMAVSS